MFVFRFKVWCLCPSEWVMCARSIPPYPLAQLAQLAHPLRHVRHLR
jgi:hypothetical protein